jgi:hypothetical protein
VSGRPHAKQVRCLLGAAATLAIRTPPPVDAASYARTLATARRVLGLMAAPPEASPAAEAAVPAWGGGTGAATGAGHRRGGGRRCLVLTGPLPSTLSSPQSSRGPALAVKTKPEWTRGDIRPPSACYAFVG